MAENEKMSVKSSEALKQEFEQDTNIIIKQANKYVAAMQPAYLVCQSQVNECVYENSAEVLDAFTFFRIKSCSSENADVISEHLDEKMTRFYTAIHALDKAIVYGIISYGGKTNLVLGVYDEEKKESELIRRIMEGLLDGVELERYAPKYTKREKISKYAGFISGVPSVRIGEEKQNFDIGSVMKSLNGQNYTLLFVSRPVNSDVVSEKYNDIIQVRDACFAVSKRNISRQYGTSHSIGDTTGISVTQSHSSSVTKTKSGSLGLSFILSLNKNWSKTESKADSHSFSKSFSETVTDAVNRTSGESHDVQNGFALEMMEYADKAIERLRQGKSNGMWETIITYSADVSMARQILEACVCGEISKPNPDLIPVVVGRIDIEDNRAKEMPVLLPKIIKDKDLPSRLCSLVTSEELGFISTPPVGAVPGFEVRIEKNYPLISDSNEGVMVGYLNDGARTLNNMPFMLSKKDLVRHTFVSGITGSGKTTTVKRILDQAYSPFLVIESAKTEYRNMKLPDGKRPKVYTLGKPEINCIQFNPFYIQNGVSPQTHIDLLKDLFNASFSFYGPMPYILEKCLHNIYKNKGWNLTLGYHPYLANNGNIMDFFDLNYTKKKYAIKTHKYLFPTMQDLKDEIERYIGTEMNYEGEVAGNIKTAIKARLESLCVGSKGYMFNTHEYIDMEKLLDGKVVFELEGLADDSDKAFAVGLMIIFVNEYRQICGKTDSKESPLKHLLVIEEAHRLLKNTATERTSEDMGNPKGKAVEHFTNMIAEMRSYGQGVIVAEQIPSKLAPDVIKNSSNKIVQRLVAVDDQSIMANTIGIASEDAMQLGTLNTGKGLCHKEGMSKPVKVDIIPVHDNVVTDTMLYTDGIDERIKKINLSILREAIGNRLAELTVQFLNALLMQDVDHIKLSIKRYRDEIKKVYLKNGVPFVTGGDGCDLQSIVMAEAVEQYLMRGTYRVKELLNNDFETELIAVIQNPVKEHIEKLRNSMKQAYDDDPIYKGKYIVAMLVINQYENGVDIAKTINNYFVVPDEQITNEIIQMIKEKCDGNTSTC